jgi:hypothetical protein
MFANVQQSNHNRGFKIVGEGSTRRGTREYATQLQKLTGGRKVVGRAGRALSYHQWRCGGSRCDAAAHAYSRQGHEDVRLHRPLEQLAAVLGNGSFRQQPVGVRCGHARPRFFGVGGAGYDPPGAATTTPRAAPILPPSPPAHASSKTPEPARSSSPSAPTAPARERR